MLKLKLAPEIRADRMLKQIKLRRARAARRAAETTKAWGWVSSTRTQELRHIVPIEAFEGAVRDESRLAS